MKKDDKKELFDILDSITINTEGVWNIVFYKNKKGKFCIKGGITWVKN